MPLDAALSEAQEHCDRTSGHFEVISRESKLGEDTELRPFFFRSVHTFTLSISSMNVSMKRKSRILDHSADGAVAVAAPQPLVSEQRPNSD